jgi:hypothetical protein
VDPRSDQISMWLGFPADALARVGLKRLPRAALLPISVQGSIKHPKVKWLECALHPSSLLLPIYALTVTSHAV